MLAGVHILVALFLWWRWFFRSEKITATAMGFLVIVKVLVGYYLSAYYLNKYGGGDMHGYMLDAMKLNGFFYQDPASFLRLIFLGDESGAAAGKVLSSLQIWYDSGFRPGYNDAQTVTRFHAILSLFTGGNLWLHLLWSNFLSVIGIRWLLIFFLGDQHGNSVPLWTWLVALLPNVLLWSSPVLKEPLLLFVMGGVLKGVGVLQTEKSVKGFLFLAVMLIAFCLIKYFWLLLMLPGIIVLLMWPSSGKLNEWRMAGVYLFCFLLVLLAGHLTPSLHLPALLYGQQLNMWRFAVFMHAGSLVEPVPFAPTDLSLLRYTPYAFIYALIQPLPSQVNTAVMWPMMLESMLLVVVLLTGLIVWVRRRMGNAVIASFGMLSGAAMMIISGLTTPVLGTLVRYRMPGVILVVLAVLNLILKSRKSSHSKS